MYTITDGTKEASGKRRKAGGVKLYVPLTPAA
jgi:hypothetical protein